MMAAKRASPFPRVEILPDRAPGRQVLRQCLPLAAGPQHVEDGVEHLADVHGARSSTALGRADQRLDQRPLHIRQVALVAQSTPIRCPAMLRLPHTAPRSKSGATQRITTASTDSTSFRMGSKEAKHDDIKRTCGPCWGLLLGNAALDPPLSGCGFNARR